MLQKSWEEGLEGAAAPNDPCKLRGWGMMGSEERVGSSGFWAGAGQCEHGNLCTSLESWMAWQDRPRVRRKVISQGSRVLLQYTFWKMGAHICAPSACGAMPAAGGSRYIQLVMGVNLCKSPCGGLD